MDFKQTPKPISHLSLRGVSFSYRNQRESGGGVVFRDISLEIFQGDRISVVGPSGAGKTTLLKLCAGILKPSLGKVLGSDGGTPLRCGFIFQHGGLWDFLTTLQNLTFPLEYAGLPNPAARERAERALSEVGLNGVSNSSVDTLSGGMKRRLQLARATLLSPSILLCDEPVLGLDPILRDDMIEWLLKWQVEGDRTLVVSSSDPEALLSLRSRWLVLDGKGSVALSEKLPSSIRDSVDFR